MLFRFSVKKTNGWLDVYDEPFRDQSDALKRVIEWCKYTFRVESVTLHRHLDSNSCGPIQLIGTFVCDGTKVINRETKEAI